MQIDIPLNMCSSITPRLHTEQQTTKAKKVQKQQSQRLEKQTSIFTLISVDRLCCRWINGSNEASERNEEDAKVLKL